jgi:hypothetical protein
MSLDRRVDPDSAVYHEVERLYRIARSLRRTTVDLWNGELYATSADTWGGFHHKTGALKLSEHRVLQHLTGSVSPINPEQQAEALATVLHEATHGGMQIDAPTQANAVRSEHSLGLIEGFAEVRAFADFDAFAVRAGYHGLRLDTPQYPGAYAATRDLMAHVTGPAYSRDDLIDDASRGPGVMHFDQFAHAVVANKLADFLPDHEAEHRAVRAALIEPMMHAHWPTLPKTSAETGKVVAREIQAALDAKIDEIRRHYRLDPLGPPGGEQPIAGAESRPASTAATRADGLDSIRFLAAQAPAAGAVAQRPRLGQGSRGPAPTPDLRGRPGHPPIHTRD